MVTAESAERWMQGMLMFLSLIIATTAGAQVEMSFANNVLFTKTGDMDGVRLAVLLPAPVTNEYQEISALHSNCGKFYTISENKKVLYYAGTFDGPTLPIVETFVYKSKPVIIDFSQKNNKNVIPGTEPNDYLDSDGKYINLKNKTIRSLGDSLWNVSKDTIDYARRCYEYVATHFKYIKVGNWRTLSEIIKKGGGECGDFSTVFITLMRYKGIPARHNIGVKTDGSYHVWADFYHTDYGWIPVDVTYKNSNPKGDFFGVYRGGLIILSQGFTTFSRPDLNIRNYPLQTFYYKYWYQSGYGSVEGHHEPSKQ